MVFENMLFIDFIGDVGRCRPRLGTSASVETVDSDASGRVASRASRRVASIWMLHYITVIHAPASVP